MRRKDGREFPAHLRIAPIRDAAGESTRVRRGHSGPDRAQGGRGASGAARRRAGGRRGPRRAGARGRPRSKACSITRWRSSPARSGIQFANVLELTDDERSFLLKAGAGFREGLVRNVSVSADWADSQAGFTMLAKEPVIVEDITREHRFEGGNLLREHGVASGVTVIVQGRGRPFGVLGAYSREPRAFSPDDVNFLQAIANVLADAIDRVRTEEETRRRALHDPLTGLPNRTLVLDRLAHALARATAATGARSPCCSSTSTTSSSSTTRSGIAPATSCCASSRARLSDAVRAGDTRRALRRRRVRRPLRGRRPTSAMALRDRRAPRARVSRAVLARRATTSTSRRPAIGIALRDGAQPTPRRCCATPTPPCTAPRSAAARASSCSTSGMRARAIGRLQTESDLRRALERDELRRRLPADRRARRRARSAASRRWCAGTTRERGLLAPARVHPGRRGERADRPARRVGARARPAARPRAWRAARRRAAARRCASTCRARQVAEPGLVDSSPTCCAPPGSSPAALRARDHRERAAGATSDAPARHARAAEGARRLARCSTTSGPATRR